MRQTRCWLITLCVLSLLPTSLSRPVAAQDREAQIAEAERLDQQVRQLYRAARYDQAIPLAKKALALHEKVLGAEHPDVAAPLNNLAMLYIANGDHESAEPLLQRALAINEKTFGPEHLDVAMVLNNLGMLYSEKGDYARAEPLYRRSLAIREKISGPEDGDVSVSLNNLGVLLKVKGDYGRAESFLRRALAILNNAPNADPSSVSNTLNNLADLYGEKGDYTSAEPLYQRALEVRVSTFGEEHPKAISTLIDLAALYQHKGEYERAAPLYRRALALGEKVLGPENSLVALTLGNLSDVYRAKGDYASAEALLRRLLAFTEESLSAVPINVAQAFNNLGMMYYERGDYARAAPLYQRALEILKQMPGRERPYVDTTFINSALLYEATGDYLRAINLLQQGGEIQEASIQRILITGSEKQKQYYLDTMLRSTSAMVSLHARDLPQSSDAARLALTIILQRKGRALDVMTDQIAALRRRANPDDQKLLTQWGDMLSRLATLQLSNEVKLTPEARRAEILRLEAEKERLEGDISLLNAEFRTVAQPVTIDAVRHAIPPGAALIEIFVYYPFDGKATGALAQRVRAPRYMAYVLRHDEALPRWAELGDVDSINALAEPLRAALRNPRREKFRPLARALDERVMRPIRKLLGPVRHIFIAPDGALNLVPFAALVDENGKYLVENYAIDYLTSGRDLLRLQFAGESRDEPKVFANPLYDLTATGQQPTTSAQANSPTTPEANNQRSKDFTAQAYKPLPGTAAEATALSKIFPDATLLTQAQATEAALKRVNRPRFLHIATHGFFLNDQPQPFDANQARAFGFDFGRDAMQVGATDNENPLLRSGLILAGVKQRASGMGEDGVLTALEAAGLDLWGTKLVVLSACDTGLGDVIDGEGVYGLRRALVLAGSETQLISLWKVSDAGTRDLMTAYYTRLQKGEGRTEALRQVQLAMLGGHLPVTANSVKRETGEADEKVDAKDYRHPYFWAAFIPSGDWRSLKGK